MAKAKEVFAIPEFQRKKIIHNWRFFIKPGKATTGPPVGQEFTKLGLKPMDFCKNFNDRTKPVFKDDVDLIIRVQVYFDKTYSYRIMPPPTAWFIMRAVRKKRKELGPISERNIYSCYITLEMAYEIAKYLVNNWNDPDMPPIETRVRRVIGQARRMGIAIIGVDAPNSPVKGMTSEQYEKKSAEYRIVQWKQYEEFKQKELETKAPLIERLHRPNLGKLTYEQLEEGVQDPAFFDQLWRATHPPVNDRGFDVYKRDMAMRTMNAKGWFKSASMDEVRALYFNWRMPTVERMRQLQGIETAAPFWRRGSFRS